VAEFSSWTNGDLPRLPEAVLLDLLERVPGLTAVADALLGPVVRQRDELRRRLLDEDPPWIWPIGAPTAGRLAAVDGGHAGDELYAMDVLIAVAAAADGLHATGRRTECTAHSCWVDGLSHSFDLDRLAKAAMIVQELHLLGGLPHELRILDGSHQTPVIVLNSALASGSSEVRRRTVELCEQFGAIEALTALCDPKLGAGIVGVPKSDSSRSLADRFQDRYGICLPAGDRFVAAQVLEPGEMLRPTEVPTEWRHLHVRAHPAASQPERSLARALHAAIAPLRRYGEGEGIGVTYLKPHSASTAVRLEFKASHGKEWGRSLAQVISQETPGPFLQEPYAQHLAHLWASAVGSGLDAVIHGMRVDPNCDPAYLEYLLRSYRTTGVSQ
jgi:hypothetical protein